MRRALRLLLVAVAATLAPAIRARAGDALATAPIDPALFRDGEVRRTADVYGAWTLVCDAIPRLNHRFCSLNAAPATIGSATMSLVVSTGDDGRPAALLRLPLGTSLRFGVRIKSTRPGAGGAEHRVPVTLCSAVACEAVWTLTADDVASLRQGPGLRISLRGWRFAGAGSQDAGPAPLTATIESRGFGEAVAASLQ